MSSGLYNKYPYPQFVIYNVYSQARDHRGWGRYSGRKSIVQVLSGAAQPETGYWYD